METQLSCYQPRETAHPDDNFDTMDHFLFSQWYLRLCVCVCVCVCVCMRILCMRLFINFIFSIGENPITGSYFRNLSWIFKILILLLLWCFEFWVLCCLVLHWVWFCLGTQFLQSLVTFSIMGYHGSCHGSFLGKMCSPKKNSPSLPYFWGAVWLPSANSDEFLTCQSVSYAFPSLLYLQLVLFIGFDYNCSLFFYFFSEIFFSYITINFVLWIFLKWMIQDQWILI